MSPLEIRILLVRSWTHKLRPVRVALRDVGVEARFTRVDIEPALDAALARGGFDVVILDALTPVLSRALVSSCMAVHGVRAPLVIMGEVGEIGVLVKRALMSRRS